MQLSEAYPVYAQQSQLKMKPICGVYGWSTKHPPDPYMSMLILWAKRTNNSVLIENKNNSWVWYQLK